jgi:hypothetical protein
MLRDYYSNPHVRARLTEFLGGTSLHSATCVYITSDDNGPHIWYAPRPVHDLWQLLDDGLDVARSLWDRRSLIAHLDIEYVNFDYPAEAYLKPARTFEVQRPVVRAIQEVLLQHGVAPLHLLSGRGHHFVWRISRFSSAFAALARLGRVPDTLGACYAQPQPPVGEIVEPELGRAFAGLGLVMELVAHHAMKATSGHCELPIELTAVEAGPGVRGREIISLDLSEYGDPLPTRSIRMPFSAYLKPQHQRSVLGEELVSQLPLQFMIPVHEMDDRQGLIAMRDWGEVTDLARRASVAIPEQSDGTSNLIGTYRRSDLARFHKYFYSTEHDPPAAWPDTYDRTPLADLPPCARRILEQPNELLLKPAGIQLVTRVLMAVGWHPRHIGGLIRSKYERDYGWGEHWLLYDAATRADFYVRLFAGQFVSGNDELVDFNCRSTQEKGYCAQVACTQNLEDYRERLWPLRDQMIAAGSVKETIRQDDDE